MKGYKAFDKGLVCNGFQYEVGKTYRHEGKIGLCEAGFHFCKNIADTANYYNCTNAEFAEIEAAGKIIEGDDKCVTNEITIIRKIDSAEFYELANGGNNNTGVRNTGDRNTGHRNTGDWNTGNWNTGIKNTGNINTGNWNTGHRNTGDKNAGDMNTGDKNTGNRNTGNGNTGNWNAGDMNTGDKNTGKMNTGNKNTGNWNNTDYSTGFFCTEKQTVKMFDIETGKTRDELLDELPSILWHIPFGNYWDNDELKTYAAQDRQNFYDSLSEAEKQKIKSIQFYDAEKFEKCTGINTEMENDDDT